MDRAFRLLELQRITAERGTWPKVAAAIEYYFARAAGRPMTREQLITVYETANGNSKE